MRVFLLFGTLVLVSVSLHAQLVTSTETVETNWTNTRSAPVSSVELEEAKGWGLTMEEWKRYKTLMQGVRSRLSTDEISPIEVLGIHANSDSERDRYARMWAQLMLEDAERILKFQRAYDIAISELIAGQPIIDPNRLQDLNENNDLKLNTADRILFFATLDCPACTVVYERISQLLNEVKSIDIYFVDVEGANQQEIGNWAKQAKISPVTVRSGKVSLNLDNGTLNELAPHIQSVPYLMLVREDKVQKFPLELVP